MYVTLELAKKHLNVESSFTDDDSYIESLIEVAEEKIAADICLDVSEMRNLSENGIPSPLKQAILLTIGTYYNNREDIANANFREIPSGVRYLTQLYRNYSR